MEPYRQNLDLRGLSDRPVTRRQVPREELDDLYDYEMAACLLVLSFLIGISIGLLLC